jgi:triacylglycerol esterase/lipase EstA (alpha/beta hydrolase family)
VRRRQVRQRQVRQRLSLAVLTIVVLATSGGVVSAASTAGPPLSVSAAALRASLRCSDNLQSVPREAVLLVPPTLADPDEAFPGHIRAFTALGIPYCTVTMPHHTTQDIQASGEFVVYAIRRMHAVTGRKVQVLGWSQGAGPEPRWALRWWPDVRPMVDDLVGLEAPNHGSAVARGLCVQSCVPALWQQIDSAKFITALNSGQETFPGISYTNIYSHTSQFVQPNLDDTGSTSLHGGGGTILNIATQQICPANTADHLAYYYDPVAFALTMDALTHPGPADPKRIDPAVCGQVSMPYYAAGDIPTYSVHIMNFIFVNRVNNEPKTNAEPPLKCYVTASCGRR